MHNYKTNWKTVRKYIENRIELKTNFKEIEHIENAIVNFNKILLEAANPPPLLSQRSATKSYLPKLRVYAEKKKVNVAVKKVIILTIRTP